MKKEMANLTDKELLDIYAKKYEKGYDNVHVLYDRFIDILGAHQIPPFLAAIKEFNVPKDSKFLDVGCGTGYSANHLYKMGYTDIEGFEPSVKMIEEAKKKNIYKKIQQGFLTVPEEMPKEYEEAFDVVFTFGVFMHPNHADAPAYECLTYVVRKGGLMIFTTDEFDQTPGEKQYKLKRKSMVKEGKWKMLKEYSISKYQGLTPEIATLGRYSTKRSDTFAVYQKL